MLNRSFKGTLDNVCLFSDLCYFEHMHAFFIFVSEIRKANQALSVLLMFVGMQMGSSSASGVDDLLWGQPQCPEHWWQYAVTHMCRQQSGMCRILCSI